MKKRIIVILLVIVIAIIFIVLKNTNKKNIETGSNATNENETTNSIENNTTENVENNTISNTVQESNENSNQQNSVKSNNIIKDEAKVTPTPNVSKDEAKVTPTPDTSKKETAPTGNTKYYIKVNYGANAVTIYEKDKNNRYTVPVKAMVCSCGTATPKSGVYKTSKGYEWGFLEGGTYGRYSTRITGSILFHSVPYVSQTEDSLEYWEYDKLGTTASLGCVRLSLEDTKWIFDNCESGTQVEFYTDSNPGPLGKPTAKKISDNEKCRNWDPTDTSPDSPWNNN